jgi:hypothetical protein
MGRMGLTRRALAIGAAAVTALALAGGIASATIPDAHKVFSACVRKAGGSIRLIDRALAHSNPMSHCTRRENLVSWNKIGQQGPAGPLGLQGPPGARGPKGDTGDPGQNGSGFTWRGPWDCNESYSPGDVVSYLGSAWVQSGPSDVGGCVDPPNAPWQQLASRGNDGAQGIQGIQGIQGPPGRTVPDTDTYYTPSYVFAAGQVGGNTEGQVTASCPAGEQVTGGGFRNGGDLNLIASEPTDDRGGWVVKVKNPRILPGSWSFGAWAICAHRVYVEHT